ncbi:MAG: hypothetical protein ABIJ28_00055 [Patescibacteria group bacterium]
MPVYNKDLCSGTVFIIDPICFPHLAGKGRSEIPNFFDVIRVAWNEHDDERLKEAVKDLKKKLSEVKLKEELERVEIETLIAVLEANISNLMKDWEKAFYCFQDLKRVIENSCKCKCFYVNKVIEVIKVNIEFCCNCATF